MYVRLLMYSLALLEGLSTRFPGWGGEGGGVDARKSIRAVEEAGLR